MVNAHHPHTPAAPTTQRASRLFLILMLAVLRTAFVIPAVLAFGGDAGVFYPEMLPLHNDPVVGMAVVFADTIAVCYLIALVRDRMRKPIAS